MSFKPKYYPYPILSPFSDDYKSFHFSPSLQIEEPENQKDLVLRSLMPLLPDCITELLINGKVELAFEIDCPGTLYRRVVSLVNDQIRIPKANLLGTVSVTPLVLAAEALDFQPVAADELNDIFAGFGPYKINKGDPLAIGETQNLAVNYEGRSSNSLIELVANPNVANNLFTINTSEDRLQIMVSPTVHNAYSSLYRNAEKRPAFIMGVVKDAILMGIVALATQSESEDVYELAWAKALTSKLMDLGFEALITLQDVNDFDFGKAHEAAQQIVRAQGIDELVVSDG